MNMGLETENFDRLRRLLALKRHEQPPPGFFNDFSSRVILEIEAGESSHTTLEEGLLSHAPWLYKLIETFAIRPAFAGVCGVAVSLLLVAGVIYSAQVDQGDSNSSGQIGPVANAEQSSFSLAAAMPATLSSTNGIFAAQRQPNLFNGIAPLAQPIPNFQPGGN
jgi:hypothetical protein